MATEVLQELDLTQSSLGENLLAEDIGDLLDSNTFLSLSIGRRTVMTIRQYKLKESVYST